MPAAHHASNPSAPRSRPGQEFSLEAWAKLLHRTVSAVAAVPLPDVALQLFLSAAVVASRAPGLDLVTYDMFEQARAGKRWKRREGPGGMARCRRRRGKGHACGCVWKGNDSGNRLRTRWRGDGVWSFPPFRRHDDVILPATRT